MLVNGSPSHSFAPGRQPRSGGRIGGGPAVRRRNRKIKNRASCRPLCEVCYKHEVSQGAAPLLTGKCAFLPRLLPLETCQNPGTVTRSRISAAVDMVAAGAARKKT